MTEVIKVHMLAHQPEYKIREVHLPELPGPDPSILECMLDRVFHYGQNEFAVVPQLQTCSVSVGDVIELDDGSFHVVCRPCGFKKITPEEFEEYKQMDRRDRTFSDFVRVE